MIAEKMWAMKLWPGKQLEFLYFISDKFHFSFITSSFTWHIHILALAFKHAFPHCNTNLFSLYSVLLLVYDINLIFTQDNWQLKVWDAGMSQFLKLSAKSQHTYTQTRIHTFQHFLLRNMNTVSRKPHFGHPAWHFISFETSGRAQPFPNAHHYERMSMRCKWQGCIVRWAQSGSVMWHLWMGSRGEGWQHPQRPIEGLQTRYKTGTGPPSLPWDGRRRLLLGTDWIEGLFWKNWREEVYYHHVTLPSVCW